MSILIVTRSDDNACIDMVSRALADLGERAVRLNTDHYPTSVRISTRMEGSNTRRTLSDRTNQADLGEVTALWYRRFFAGGRLPPELGQTREACVGEARRTLYGTIAALGAFQLDPLICVRKTDHKELQLEKAREFGMAVPATLITNDPEAAREFYRDHDQKVVTKTQSSFAIYRGGEEQVVFTTPVQPEHMEQLDGLRYAPMMFQEWVPKALELRATVVGKRVFTAAVDSQKAPRTQVDWRRDGVGLLEAWEPYALPPAVEAALLRITDEFGLNYGAADFIVTPEGQHVFLEINAGGEWFWLQRVLPIAEALAEVLAGKAERRTAFTVGAGS